MQRLFVTYGRLLAETDLTFTRYLYEKIDWNNRLIVIKGAKGVGKTTMLLQHIKRTFTDVQKALYASVDHIWFSTHTILELAEYHYTHGGTHLFLDEIHKYSGWQQEIKNLYDSYPQLHIVITGSSMLKLEESLTADLSRRHRLYTMEGLSFREYLKLEEIADFQVITLDEILNNHFIKASEITAKVKVLPYFEKYVRMGYYPFYKDDGDGFDERLQQVINTILESEIPAVSKIEYDSIYKAKQLLGILAEQVPYTMNISSICSTLETSRNNVLKLFDLMNKAALIRRLYSEPKGMKMLNKPEKVLFNNTNIMYALSPSADSGTMRETFLASQICIGHSLSMPDKGDLTVDGTYTFEVGGKKKNFAQISDVENSYVVSDNIEIGMGNKIPLWLFGLLY